MKVLHDLKLQCVTFTKKYFFTYLFKLPPCRDRIGKIQKSSFFISSQCYYFCLKIWSKTANQSQEEGHSPVNHACVCAASLLSQCRFDFTVIRILDSLVAVEGDCIMGCGLHK